MKNPYQNRRSKLNPAAAMETSLERYRFFIHNIVDTASVWGLYQDGWAIGASSQGRHSLALWGGRAYAQLCQTGTWSQYQPTAITLESFIFKMLPYTIQNKVLLSIMMTPDGKSVFLEPNKVLLDLKNYLYEVHSTKPDFFTQNPEVPLPRNIRIHELSHNH